MGEEIQKTGGNMKPLKQKPTGIYIYSRCTEKVDFSDLSNEVKKLIYSKNEKDRKIGWSEVSKWQKDIQDEFKAQIRAEEKAYKAQKSKKVK